MIMAVLTIDDFFAKTDRPIETEVKYKDIAKGEPATNIKPTRENRRDALEQKQEIVKCALFLNEFTRKQITEETNWLKPYKYKKKIMQRALYEMIEKGDLKRAGKKGNEVIYKVVW